jgi:hypothetical protein
LNPSAFVIPDCPLAVYDGKFALPVPKFQCIEVSTYPLRVVGDNAVKTEAGFSSARVTAGRLTKPAPIRAKVHSLHFMMFNYGFVLVSGYSTLFLFVLRQRLQHIWSLYGTCCAKREPDRVNPCKQFVYRFITPPLPPATRKLLARVGQKSTPCQESQLLL